MRDKIIIILILGIMLLFISCDTDPVNAMMENTTNVFVKNKTPDNVSKSSMTLLAQNDENTEEAEPEETAEAGEFDPQSVADTIFKKETYAYKSRYRRDPFTSVLELQRQGLNEMEIETASYYGMIQGKNGKMALFKDATGLGYVFYEGQKIKNGVLLKIEQDSVIFKLQEYGVVRNKVIKLQNSEKK